MKKALMMICCIALFPATVKANCYQIKDNDLKNNCLAMEKRQVSYCYQIKNSDDKNYCLAKLKGQRSYCYQIKASDKKNECLTFINN